ncbi:MAG: glycosyltransferase family 29 protein [Rhodobacteraceae bacterium]|uniref:glycosyltransferase family 29 protein n=1 Tax=Tabrizicola sp. SY72 TaxID=2741673 RepID=UPI001574ECA1|nr:glycosyltransferase family 29 protein [Tabrizicola sp. SY72]MBL9056656.1 glycosyltransferase family 29 protein [Paracoccaceae bacterium]NTT84305.1 glycosyltransferase family 29 protein [Tabrizicola sp. SY72]
MTRLGFLIARLTGDETALERLSAPPEALAAELAGKRVALIGNARSLSASRNGASIDAADLVIRINGAPIPAAVSHGTRTDWLAVSMPPDAALLAARAPARVLWMTRKRKRLPFALTRRPGFYLHRRAEAQALADHLGAPPTTGLMLIDLLARSSAAEVALYGFDFFSSLSLSGSRTAAQVPHDFAAERGFVEALIARDPRFRLVAAA